MEAVMDKETPKVERFTTTNLYQMAYLKNKGMKIIAKHKGHKGKEEITFEGPDVNKLAVLYHSSRERVLLDDYIIMRAIVYGEIPI